MVEEAFDLFAEHYEGADRARFEEDLADKRLVVVLEDSVTGRLRGFSTVHVSRRRDVRGRACTVVFSGDTVIHHECWGQGQLQRVFTRLLLRIKLRRPWQPLYWFLICKGYRTYLLLVNHVHRAVPRHDLQPPRRLQAMLDVVATERFGEHYDADLGLVRWPEAASHEHVRPDIGAISQELTASNPHVALFVERNPEYERGDELACLGDMTLWTMVREGVRTSVRAVTKSRRALARRPATVAR